MKSIRVGTPSAAYDVLIGVGLLDRLGELCAARLARPARRAFIAHDAGLASTLVARVAISVSTAGMKATIYPVVASESRKTMHDAEALLMQVAASRHERFEPIIALGGGIVGDVAGFAASVYRRGVPIVQCPTTLLSMVDASVGGKTGVNLLAGNDTADGYGASIRKNLVGAFHQPSAVIADVAALDSLPDRQIRAGLAECLKHGMIAGATGCDQDDPGLFEWTTASIPALLAKDQEALVELVARNVAIKAAVVGGDEREELPSEQGGRALLNLGHTFGHAIETIPGLAPDGDPSHAPLHHGEAIAIGLVAACHCSLAAGMCSAGLVRTVESAVGRAGLPTRLKNLPSNDVLHTIMTHDKKVVGGKVRLVLPVGHTPGSAVVREDIARDRIDQAWDAIRGT
ncbi:MAG: 3-dehydroquinate synthase [Phycisphaeraceae bacterium]|nr:3-dehydroquinate synthase [Phycisphaerae bacterium]MBX3391490.1 3-dehydroquinate synthase [Phycisphaeraceae bacterium]HRJ49294.1 3-dehydroquinate synthase family protein [Phycisphaerales bacterium]